MATPIGRIPPSAEVPGDLGTRRLDLFRREDVTFADTLERVLGEVSGLQDQARDVIGAFVRGEPVELHQVMAAAEEAEIALTLLIEMRNKLVEAYRTVVNMQA